MSQRKKSAKPEQVKTLTEWVARWPKSKELKFDPVTREPTVYKGADVETTISWKREADTLTVLSQPSRFTAQAVEMARRRYGKIGEQKNQMRLAGEEQLRLATATLLESWRTYNATDKMLRGPLRRDIMSAEADVRAIEAQMAPKDRVSILTEEAGRMMTGIYIPPMTATRRGISLTGSDADPSPSSSLSEEAVTATGKP